MKDKKSPCNWAPLHIRSSLDLAALAARLWVLASDKARGSEPSTAAARRNAGSGDPRRCLGAVGDQPVAAAAKKHNHGLRRPLSLAR